MYEGPQSPFIDGRKNPYCCKVVAWYTKRVLDPRGWARSLGLTLMSQLVGVGMGFKKAHLLLLFTLILPLFAWIDAGAIPLRDTSVCTGEFISVGTPLTDLGNGEYVRLSTGATGFTGGLYPGGSNTRPPEHEQAGIAIARQVVPLDIAGVPHPGGRIVLLSIGMSNTFMEFRSFSSMVRTETSPNPAVALINGAQPGEVATEWLDLEAPSWEYVDSLLSSNGLSPQQVQVAWVKLTNIPMDQFPRSAQKLQNDLKVVMRNLKARYPNVRLAYLSSRTRSYTYWYGLNPEPGAYETGFAVKWLVEEQINGAPDLNYDPEKGPVVAPYLSWGPYLWANGANPRLDGMVWLPEDMVRDCTHPSPSGSQKIGALLLAFFRNDPTTSTWFQAPYNFFLPLVGVDWLRDSNQP